VVICGENFHNSENYLKKIVDLWHIFFMDNFQLFIVTIFIWTFVLFLPICEDGYHRPELYTFLIKFYEPCLLFVKNKFIDIYLSIFYVIFIPIRWDMYLQSWALANMWKHVKKNCKCHFSINGDNNHQYFLNVIVMLECNFKSLYSMSHVFQLLSTCEHEKQRVVNIAHGILDNTHQYLLFFKINVILSLYLLIEDFTTLSTCKPCKHGK